ncbi:mdm2-binding protein-like [Lineus longissimus]|uniref:mdm2-binding protein-like n=1 Tax=Lineus longissimus TaxID=88925 RepID=UPI002B4F4677
MDRYTIVLCSNWEISINDDVIKNLGKSFSESTTWRCPRSGQLHQSQRFISSILMPLEEREVPSNESDSSPDKWTKVPESGEDELVTFLQEIVKENTDEVEKPVADAIHGLADNLPDSGYYVDILWVLGDNQAPDISENVSLYGALKRMIEWHNGRITFVTSSVDTGHLAASPWVKFLQVVIKTPADYLIEDLVWRGRINVTDQKTKASLTLPGFVLQASGDKISDSSADLMSKLFPKSPSPKRSHSVRKTRQDKSSQKEGLCLSSRLEFLEEIPYTNVPSFFVTNRRLELSLLETGSDSEAGELTKSEVLFNHIQQNKKMCSFMRLWFSTSQPKRIKPVKKKDPNEKEKTGTDIWQSKLLQNELTMPEQPLTGPLDYYTFLIHPGEKGKLSAYLLRQPRELNGGVVEILMKCPGPVPINQSHTQNVHQLLKQLPSMAPELITQMNEDIFGLQTTVLQKWIAEQEEKEELATLSESELYFLLNTVRETYIGKVQEKIVSKPTKINDVSHLTFRTPPSELDLDPCEWLERYALTERENTEKMQRIKSMDRIGGVPPPPKEKEDDSLKLDAAQFLKMFAPTGAPVAECLSPIRCPNAKSRLKLPKYNSREVKNAEWPECTKYNYHGIYYNASSESELQEARFGRIRDRYIWHETSSTCTLEQKAKPATVAMLKSCISTKPRDKIESKFPRNGSSDDFSRERRVAPKRSAAKTTDAPPSGKNRKSPRLSKTEGANKSAGLTKPAEDQTQNDEAIAETALDKKARDKAKAISRSERHKRKLQSIVDDVLIKKGMTTDNPAHKACSERLFRVTKAFVMDLKSSWNLSEEMRKIAEEQVQMVIDFQLKKNKKESEKK